MSGENHCRQRKVTRAKTLWQADQGGHGHSSRGLSEGQSLMKDNVRGAAKATSCGTLQATVGTLCFTLRDMGDRHKVLCRESPAAGLRRQGQKLGDKPKGQNDCPEEIKR